MFKTRVMFVGGDVALDQLDAEACSALFSDVK